MACWSLQRSTTWPARSRVWAYDVVGFAPADTGTVLCCDCAAEHGLDAVDEEDGSPIFACSEWDSAPTCDECNEELDVCVMGKGADVKNEVFEKAEADRVGAHVAKAWRAAKAVLDEIGEAAVFNIDDALMTWAKRLRLSEAGPKEHVVVCEMEITSDTDLEAAQDVCDLMHKALNEERDGGLYFTVYTRSGSSFARLVPTRKNVNGRLLAERGLTVTANGDVYAGLPEIHVAEFADSAEHVRDQTHATLNLKTLLESLSDEQLRAHLEWRTPDDDLGRNVDKARGARGEHARQRPRLPSR